MNSGIIWSSIVVEEFLSLANLTPDEKTVFRDRVKGKSRVWISMERGYSLSTVDRIIKRLKLKYDAVQPYTPILPRRIGSTVPEFFP